MATTDDIAKLLNISVDNAGQYCLDVQKFCTFKVRYKIIEKYLMKYKNETLTPEELAMRIRIGMQDSLRPIHSYKEEANKQTTDNREPQNCQNGSDKCEHGVPLFRTCAICNPDKFRFETGID